MKDIVKEEYLESYKQKVHAPVEKYFCDTSVHRVFGVDVTCDDDLENFSDTEIENAIISCMKEDIVAVSIKRGGV